MSEPAARAGAGAAGRLVSGVIAILAVAALCSLLTAAAATAQEPVASYATPGCDSAPTWRIGYRLYWADTAGRTTTRAALERVKQSTELFVVKAGALSSCGARVQVDIYDMGATPWSAADDPGAYPADERDFADTHGYDATFSRYPGVGQEDYNGIAAPAFPYRAKFPVDQAGGPNYADRPSDPSPMILMHEWLHLVVAFYPARLGWPADDVHGACEHGYAQDGCHVNERYFADLLSGRVVENGQPKGIQPDDWTNYGTPRSPRHADPQLSLSPSGDYVGVDVADRDAVAPLEFTLVDAAGTVVDRQRAVRARDFVAPAGTAPGEYQLCVDFAGNERYRAAHACTRIVVAGRADALVHVGKPHRSGDRITATLMSKAPAVGHAVDVRWDLRECRPSAAGHRCMTRVVRERITLRSRQAVRTPRLRPGTSAALTVSVPSIKAGMTPYKGGVVRSRWAT